MGSAALCDDAKNLHGSRELPITTMQETPSEIESEGTTGIGCHLIPNYYISFSHVQTTSKYSLPAQSRQANDDGGNNNEEISAAWRRGRRNNIASIQFLITLLSSHAIAVARKLLPAVERSKAGAERGSPC